MSVDREGIQESLMAAVDLEPAERIRVNQREEVLILHASHPPTLMIQEKNYSIQYTGIQAC